MFLLICCFNLVGIVIFIFVLGKGDVNMVIGIWVGLVGIMVRKLRKILVFFFVKFFFVKSLFL